MRPRVLLGCALVLASSLAAAQPPATRPAELGELFYQIQLLQQEVMQLRGQLEAQDKQLRDLKQQRLDDYINLDRRLSELSAAPAPAARPPAPAAGSGTPAAAVPAVPAATVPVSESEAYQQAFALVRTRQFAEATTAFTAFLTRWPDGSMAPNAYYWLGELALQDNRLDEANRQFRVVIDRFPRHDKVPDAQFKLARIHHLRGDTDKARELLRQVISQYPGSNAAQLAQNYLNSQF